MKFLRVIFIKLTKKLEKVPGIFLIMALILNLYFFNWLGNLLFLNQAQVSRPEPQTTVTYKVNSNTGEINRNLRQDSVQARELADSSAEDTAPEAVRELTDNSEIKSKQAPVDEPRSVESAAVKETPETGGPASPDKTEARAKQSVNIQEKAKQEPRSTPAADKEKLKPRVEEKRPADSPRKERLKKEAPATTTSPEQEKVKRDINQSKKAPEVQAPGNMAREKTGAEVPADNAARVQPQEESRKKTAASTAVDAVDKEDNLDEGEAKTRDGKEQQRETPPGSTDSKSKVETRPGNNQSQNSKENGKENGDDDSTEDVVDFTPEGRDEDLTSANPPAPESRTAPEYPPQMRERGIEGRVLLMVIIDNQGQVDRIDIEEGSGYDSLDRAAVKAVAEWTFKPAQTDEQPVAARVLIPIKFQLK